MTKKKQITHDWELIRQEYRTGKFSVRAIAKKHNISHTAINNRRKKEGWEQDLSQKIRSAVRSKLVSKKAKEIVSTLEGGNPEEINKIAEQLSDEETVEYAALSDLAFLSLWHDQFNKTLEAVSTMKQELIKNQTVVKVDKDGKEIIGPIRLSVKSPQLVHTTIGFMTAAITYRQFSTKKLQMCFTPNGITPMIELPRSPTH